MEILTSLSWLDIAIATILVLYALSGMKKGGILVMASILAWTLAFYLSFSYGDRLAIYLKELIINDDVRLGSARVIVFILVLVFWLIIGNLLSNTKGGVKFLDHLLGLVLGFIKGVLILALILVIIALAKSSTVSFLAIITSLPETEIFRHSILVPYLLDVAEWIKGFFPVSWQELIKLTPETSGSV